MTGPEAVTFDERFRDLSFGWLTEPETARLARVPPLTIEGQHVWFAALAGRTDYAVWGLTYDGVPVGAVGLRHIGLDGGAEEFVYVGEKSYRGRGIAGWALLFVAEQARARGLSHVRAVVGADNARSLQLHVRQGFRVVDETPEVVQLVLDL